MFITMLSASMLILVIAGWTEGDPADSEARQRLSAMSAAEKQELDAKRARFYAMPENDQQRLRQVHRDLSEADDREQLQQIMQNYAKWLRSLQSGARAELVSLPPESRIERIKQLLQEQESWRMRKYAMSELTPDDRAVIVKWMEEFVSAHEEQILERMPHWKQRWDSLPPAQRLNMLIFAATAIRPVRELLLPTEEEMNLLKKQLSGSARQELSRAEKEGRLPELAERWLRAAMLSRRALPEVSREELQQFYSDLDQRQREYLENMSAERMEQELTRLYHFERYRRFVDAERAPFSRSGGSWWGRPRGGRPGTDRPDGDRPPGPPSGDRPGMPRPGPPRFGPPGGEHPSSSPPGDHPGMPHLGPPGDPPGPSGKQPADRRLPERKVP
ncbi:MAG: hypothetical protein EA424_13915 [Planctomycetaceae bacterium]|nr:MAG: hypothetical protein EA424_13915 [Planctomycetaceae bacterium]